MKPEASAIKQLIYTIETVLGEREFFARIERQRATVERLRVDFRAAKRALERAVSDLYAYEENAAIYRHHKRHGEAQSVTNGKERPTA